MKIINEIFRKLHVRNLIRKKFNPCIPSDEESIFINISNDDRFFHLFDTKEEAIKNAKHKKAYKTISIKLKWVA